MKAPLPSDDDDDEGLKAKRRCTTLETKLQETSDRLQRVQEELSWKTAFLEALANSAIDGIIVVDQLGRKILQNQRVAELFEIPRHIVDDPDDTVQVRWVTEMAAHPAEFIAKVVHLYSHRDEISRDEIELNDGRVLDRYSSPVIGKDEQYYGRIWTFRDITELKRAAAALQAGERRLRNLIDGMGPAMFVGLLTPEGILVEVNQAPLIAAGLKPEDVLGKPFDETHWWSYSLESQAQLREAMARAARGESSRYDVRTQGAGNRIIDIDFSLQPLRDETGEVVFLIPSASDITARKSAEKALQRQQTEMRVLFDLIPAMIWFKDTHNGILRVNQRVATAAGMPLDAIEGRPTLEVYPQEAARFYADDLEVIRSGVPKFGYVESMRGEHGEELWVETDKVPYCDKDGQVVGIVVMAQDITARRLAEQVLRESEELFRFLNDLAEVTRTLADPAQIMAATSRMLGGHLHVSRCAYADVADDGELFTILHDYIDGCASTVGHYQLSLFGPKVVDMLHSGQTLIIRNVTTELLPGEGADTFKAIDIQAIICCPLVKDGALRAMMAVHQTTPRNWRPGEVALVQDVVGRCWGAIERRTAEENLRASKRFAESIAEHSPNIIYLFDLDTGRNVYANRNAAESLGYSQAQILAMGDDLLPTIIHAEDLARVLQHYAQFAEVPDRCIIDLEYRMRHVNGDTRWVWTRDTVFNRRANGDAWQIMGTAQDITARKQAEAELANTHRELLETSRLAGMAEVATGVLHNVGNVLNSVNIAASCLADSLRQSKAASLGKVVALLQDHAGDLGAFLTSDPKGRKLPGYLAQLAEHLVGEQAAALTELARLQKNIEHIKDIVNMQQGFAKVSGLVELLQAADLVEDALRMNASSFTRHDITVIKEFALVPSVAVEKHKVLQILINLLRNAKHACDDCGRADKRLTLRLSSDAEHVRIAVSDNGIGIPPENLTRIFAHGFTTKKSGHGFGLHSGALAAREMGGALTVYSEGSGHGATFTLELPCRATEGPPA